MTATPEVVLERHPFELRVLTQIAKTLTSRLPLPDLLNQAMDRLNASLGPADVGIIYLWDGSSGVFCPRHPSAAMQRPWVRSRWRPASHRRQGLLRGRPRLYSSESTVAEAMVTCATATGGLCCKPWARHISRAVCWPLLCVWPMPASASCCSTRCTAPSPSPRPTALHPDAGRPAGTGHRPRPLEENDEVVREVRRSERLRSELMATLSHELRTPLAAIRGYATALMIDEIRWPKWKRDQFLRLIDDEFDNLQAMISDIHDLSLIDIGQLAIVPQPLRLPHLLSEVASEMQRRTRVHRIVVDTPPDFPILDADPHRIKQVVRNLLDNAIKYSPTGGLVVLRAEVSEVEVTVSVSDQGVGISPQDMIPLFDKYFRPVTGGVSCGRYGWTSGGPHHRRGTRR